MSRSVTFQRKVDLADPSQNPFGQIIRAARMGFYYSKEHGVYVRVQDKRSEEDTFELTVCSPGRIWHTLDIEGNKKKHREHYVLESEEVINETIARAGLKDKVRYLEGLVRTYIIDGKGEILQKW